MRDNERGLRRDEKLELKRDRTYCDDRRKNVLHTPGRRFRSRETGNCREQKTRDECVEKAVRLHERVGSPGVAFGDAVVIERPDRNTHRTQNNSKRKENPVRVGRFTVLVHRVGFLARASPLSAFSRGAA